MVTEPDVLDIMTSYDPASPVWAADRLNEGLVAPEIAVPSLRHWKLGAGTPIAPTSIEMEEPARTVREAGLNVTTGAKGAAAIDTSATALEAAPKELLIWTS